MAQGRFSPRRAWESITSSRIDDPVVWWLRIGIGLTVATAAVAVLYGLLTGLVSPSTPRTAAEAQLVLLESVVKETPGSGAAWRDYASALYASGRKGDARDVLSRSKKAVKDLDRTFPLLIELDQLWAEGEYERVAVKSKRAYESDQKYKQEYIEKRAQDGRRIALKDLPATETIAILVYQARAAGALERWDDAVGALDTALALDPNAADLLALRGEARLNAGDAKGARVDFETALKFVPDMPAALAGLERLESQ